MIGRQNWSLLAVLGLGALLAGCANQADEALSRSGAAPEAKLAAPAASGGAPAAGAASANNNAPDAGSGGQARPSTAAPSAAVTPPAPDRYLIRNANLTIEVKDARIANDRLLAAVRVAHGYVSNLQETMDGLGVRTITLQVRVPATLFDSSMHQLSSLGKVLDKKVTAEDVTEEYVDTQSTLRNLNRTEARLLEHLSRTGRLSDTLLIEKELTRVREEIERREGRLRFLAHRVEFSTIDVALREEAKALPPVPAQSYSTGKEATEATRSLVEFLRGVWTLAIWVGIWAVVWAPLGLVVAWGVRTLARKRRAAPPTHTPPSFFPPDEPVGPPAERTVSR